MRSGVQQQRRVYESAGVAILAAGVIVACTFATPSWDSSENRGNSFSESDERALESIHQPLSIEVHLAQEDPRRVDLENHALSKLRRVMPAVKVTYVAATSIGLFEQSNPGYGEIRYELGGRKTMSRAITAEAVLEAIYFVAQMKPPAESDEDVFRGHPLAVAPRGAGTLFYIFWPGLFLASALIVRRRLI
jgi:hypothetical protein